MNALCVCRLTMLGNNAFGGYCAGEMSKPSSFTVSLKPRDSSISQILIPQDSLAKWHEDEWEVVYRLGIQRMKVIL